MNNSKLLSALVSFLLMILIVSCQREEFEFNPKVNFETRTGQLSLVEGSSVDFSDLEVLSFAESSDFDDQGRFELKATEADKFQQLLVLSKNTRNVVYIGLYNPSNGKVTLNDTSTVLSLLLLNPHLLYSSHAQREKYIEIAKQNNRFPQLISIFRESVQSDPDMVFDLESNTIFYQEAAQIMKETIEYLELVGSKSASAVLAGGEPYIEDGSGENIVFVNPRHVYYGAGIYNSDESFKETVTVNRQAKIISFKLESR